MRARAGVVLLFTLVGLLLLQAIIVGAFQITIQQVRVARAHVRAIELDAAVKSGVAAGLLAWPAAEMEVQPPGAWVALTPTTAGNSGGVTTAVSVRRLADDLFLLRAEALTPAGERRAAGVLLRTRTPVQYLEALGAGVTARSVDGSGSIETVSAETCSALDPDVPELIVTDSSPDWRAVVVDSLPTIPVLAGVDLSTVSPAAPAGAFPLHPAVDGDQCDAEPASNFGAPNQSGHPCAEFAPLRTFGGDLRLDGGAGQGILLVLGNLELAGGTSFDGVVLVSGDLSLGPGAIIRGAVRSGGRLQLQQATITIDPCTVLHLLALEARLRGPFRASRHWWLPAL